MYRTIRAKLGFRLLIQYYWQKNVHLALGSHRSSVIRKMTDMTSLHLALTVNKKCI